MNVEIIKLFVKRELINRIEKQEAIAYLLRKHKDFLQKEYFSAKQIIKQTRNELLVINKVKDNLWPCYKCDNDPYGSLMMNLPFALQLPQKLVSDAEFCIEKNIYDSDYSKKELEAVYKMLVK